MSLVQVIVFVVPAVQFSPPLGEVTVTVSATALLKLRRHAKKVIAAII
jgi:hypothetical protein